MYILPYKTDDRKELVALKKQAAKQRKQEEKKTPKKQPEKQLGEPQGLHQIHIDQTLPASCFVTSISVE